MSDGMGREFTYLSSHATNRYFIPNWGSTIEYVDDVYIFDLGMGVVEAYPVFDDGEPYDYSLRLVGKVIKNKNHHV